MKSSFAMHLCALCVALALFVPWGFGEALSEGLDWSGVREGNGRVVGSLALPDGLVHIDAPAPPDFVPGDVPILKVAYRRLTQKEIDLAFDAAGLKRDKKKSLDLYAHRDYAYAEYAVDNQIGGTPIEGSAFDLQTTQAEAIVRAFLRSLGYADSDFTLTCWRWTKPERQRYPNMTESRYRRLLSTIEEEERTWGFAHDTVTTVQVQFLLHGIEAPFMVHWMEGSDKCGAMSDSHFNISDTGEIVGFMLSNLAIEQQAEPIAHDWRTALEATATGDTSAGGLSLCNPQMWIDTQGVEHRSTRHTLTRVRLIYRCNERKIFRPQWEYTVECVEESSGASYERVDTQW